MQDQNIANRLQDLQNGFVQSLPERMALIRQDVEQLASSPMSIQASLLNRLNLRLHKLTGAAGTFRMRAVSEASHALARVCERMLSRGVDAGSCESAMNGLARLEALSSEPPVDSNWLSRSVDLPVQPSMRLALVEDDPDQAAQLGEWLEQAGYEVSVYHDVESFSAAFAENPPPDVLVMDMHLQGNEVAGAEKIAELQDEHAELPPVLFVSVLRDLKSRLMALRAGASRYLTKPVAPQALVAAVDEFSGRQPAEPFRVLMVDDDVRVMEANALVLRQAGFEVAQEAVAMAVPERIQQWRPDVLLLDIYMPEVSGPELATLIREDAEHQALSIVFLSAESDPWRRLLMLGMGGDDFLVKPLDPEHLVAAVRARAKRARALSNALCVKQSGATVTI
jgi:DNA-binding response OmpR family regulator